ncbi:MAG: sulfotransferase domain-containing protein [Lyngbya sp.]|nr:sulfotransferase domain-containing protein [Lyngbya sp.]
MTPPTVNSSERRQPPHFMILGTQKGGTNSLYNYLCQHPQILSATQKEIHFFTLHYQKGIDWYRSQFPSTADGKLLLTGEGTPYYLFHPAVPQRVYHHFPQMKFIVLLRNPVDRAISHYYWEVNLGYEMLSLEEAIHQEPERLQGETEKLLADETYYSYNHQHYSYLSRGIYIEQLQNWMKLFSREQFLILKSEAFSSDSPEILNQVFEFLGLPAYQLPNYKKYNVGDYPEVSSKIRQKLADYFQPSNDKLEEFLGQGFVWKDELPITSEEEDSSINLPEEITSSPFFVSTTKIKKSIMNESKIDYEGAWDDYVKNWQSTNSEYVYPGDEWIGLAAGAAQTLAEYETLIEEKFIAPYIKPHQTVLEIGIGGGKTAALLLKYCQSLICADISTQMLQVTRERLGEERVSYVKLDGLSLNGINAGSVDVCFCYDTMVHIEPRDIFNYLTQIPRVMRGERLCLFHHTNILSELGWNKFLSDWDKNLLGRRHGTAFSVMTDSMMEKFLTHLNYEILLKDTQTVPRDCVWVCRAPAEI